MMPEGDQSGPPQWMRHCRAFIDSVGDQLLVIDRSYRLMLVNQAFLESSGMAEDEILGRPCHEITHRSAEPCWVYGHACPLSAVVESGNTITVTHEHFDSAGRTQYVDIVGSPARDDQGEVVGVIEALRDVTRQKELEAALRQRNLELEQARVKHQHFISAVCHELKNILNGVSLNGQLLRSDKHSDATRRRAQTIVDESKRLERLIEDMRDAAAIETQRFSIQRHRCELGEVVQQCVDAKRLDSPSHAIQLELNDVPLEGTWDAGRLRQVVDNLLSNAIKFSPEQSEVRVRVWRAGDLAHISVSDRGLGIPEDATRSLFEPYVRTHAHVPGLGLGLFVSRGIIEAHGGEISASRRASGGSTFSLVLPIDAAPPAVVRPARVAGG